MTELRHGYTLADLHGLARLAVHTAGTMASNWHDRYDTAWSAVAEHLYAAEHWPPRHDLVRAGQLAIYRTVTDDRHHHGYYKHKTVGAAAGSCSSPAFRTYWADWITNVAQPADRALIERVALAQILPALTPTQREAIAALAAHDDYRAAADALGMTYATFKSHIARGRNRFLALWHEGERPSRPWGTDRRVGSYARGRSGNRTIGAVLSSRRKHKRSSPTTSVLASRGDDRER